MACFFLPWLHQSLGSRITWLYRSHYPTSMTCGESCSHLIGKPEVHALHYPPLFRMAPDWDMGFFSRHQIMSQKLFVRCRLTTKLWQARLEKRSKEIKSEQLSLQEWCATTLEWKFESNRISIDKDMLRDSPWDDRTVLMDHLHNCLGLG